MIGRTGDLLDRLDGQDVVTFTGCADTALKLRAQPQPAARARSRSTPRPIRSTAAILGPDVRPDDEEFDLFVKEVAREMTVKAGQKCTAIRRAIVPRRTSTRWPRGCATRLAKTVVGDPARRGRAHGRARVEGAAAPTSPSASRCSPRATRSSSARATASRRWATAWPNGAFFAPTLLLAATPHENDAVHDVEAFGPV